jgi:hypothetical protein
MSPAHGFEPTALQPSLVLWNACLRVTHAGAALGP